MKIFQSTINIIANSILVVFKHWNDKNVKNVKNTKIFFYDL